MTLLRLAIKNVMSNFKHYLLYFISTIISIVIYFIFVTLKYAPVTVLRTEHNTTISSAFTSVSFVILVFVALFIWLSNAFFIRSRKKEVGIYTFSGVKQSTVAAIMFIENLMVGIGSIVIGLLIGLLLSRLATMLLANMMNLSTQVEFYFSMKGMLETISAFSIIFIVTSVNSALMVYRFKVIDLINAHRTEERAPKHSKLKALLGFSLMLSGYALSQCVMILSQKMIWVMLGTLVLTISGTYLFFNASILLVLNHLKGKPKLLFRGTHILTLNHLIFRIQNNAKAMATIAVLSASTISALGAALTFADEIQNIYKYMSPYTIQVITEKPHAGEARAFVDRELPKLGVQVQYDLSLDLPVLKGQFTPIRIDDGKTYDPFDFAILSESQIKQLALTTGKIKKLQHQTFKNDEALFVTAVYNQSYMAGNDGKGNKTVRLENGQTYSIVAYEDAVVIPHIVFGNYLVVKDHVYRDLLKESKNPLSLRFINTNNPDTSKLLGQAYNQLNPSAKKNFDVFTVGTLREQLNVTKGLNLFLTIFVCLIFIMASGSVIYFKQMTEAVHEVGKYETLYKLGIHPEEIKTALSHQLGFMFGAPYLVALIHSIFALMALGQMVGTNLTAIGVVAALVYLLMYIIFYLITRHSYYKLIEPKGL